VEITDSPLEQIDHCGEIKLAFVTAQFKTLPVLKPAARFKTGQPVIKLVNPI